MTESKLQLPEITNISESNGILSFDAKCNVSVINGLRRTLTNDVTTVCLKTEPFNDKNSELESTIIYENTTSFTNEILKQRLGCIPVHLKTPDNIENLIIEVDKENTGNSIELITTEDFMIKDKNTNRYLTKDQVKKIFPPSKFTNDYIIFARIKPGVSKTVQGEKLRLACRLFESRGKVSGQYNVCSTAAYNNMIDEVKQTEAWSKIEDDLSKQGILKTTINDKKKNWYLLEGKRLYFKNKFQFRLETIGVFTNEELIKKACLALNVKFHQLSEKITNNEMVYTKDSINVKNSFDVKLFDIGYSVGKNIEYMLHDRFFNKTKILTYVGFIKRHPHDDHSIVRVVFKDDTKANTDNIRSLLQSSIDYCIQNYTNISESFV
jgi:hypothetical protein